MTALFTARLAAAQGLTAKALVWIRALLDVTTQALAGRAKPSIGFGQDVRYALRTLRRAPVFTVAAVLTLALGMGTVTALYSVLDAVVLRSLPYGHPERLATVSSPFMTRENLAEWQREQRVVEELVGYALLDGSLDLPGGAVPVSVAAVGRGFFDMLGVTPELGRPLGVGDHQRSSAAVALVTHSFWERYLQAVHLPAVLPLNGRDYEIVGVLPSSFTFRRVTQDVWVPLEGVDERRVAAVARLRAGVTPEVAESTLAGLAARLATPAVRAPLRGVMYSDVTVSDLKEGTLLELSGTLWTLFAAAGLVLLVACANVTALLLGRMISRRSEFSIRWALGAGRARLTRQLLVEASVLSAAGSALGLIIAGWGPRLLIALSHDPVLEAGRVHLSPHVLAFAAAAAMVSVLLFGLVPAFLAARRARQGTAGPRTVISQRSEGRAQGLLVVAEVAATLVLVAGAGLLLRTFLTVRPVHPGFQIEDRMVTSVRLSETEYETPERRADFLRRLLDRVHALPGAPRTAAATDLPLTGMSMVMRPVRLDGDSLGGMRPVHLRSVTPGYFELMGMPMVVGRGITEDDGPGAPLAAVVNQRAAEQLWPDVSNVIGHRMTLDLNDHVAEVTVVGVVRDTWILRGPGSRAAVFVSFWQLPYARFQLVVESTPSRPVSEADLRSAMAAVDPRVPLRDTQTLRDRTAWSWVFTRFQATLLGTLAAIALALAAVGTFAVLSHLVGRRTRELALRAALGAQRGQVMGLVAARGLMLTGTGLVLGLALSWASTRLLAGELVGVTPMDPATLAGASAVLLMTSLAAMLRPLLRATRVDPARPLREE